MSSDELEPLRRSRPDRLLPDDPPDPEVLAVQKARLMSAITAAGVEPRPLPSIYPRLAYTDEMAALEFLTRAFGLVERREARMEHPDGTLAWLEIGDGVVMISRAGKDHHGLYSPLEVGAPTAMLNVYVNDVDAHYERARTEEGGHVGYKQELRRGVGTFASFAAGFSFVSILTTVFQLFGLGFLLGGAAFFWSWPVVFAGQLAVALCFSELAGRWPVSGVIFQWSSRLAGTTWGWFTGWIMVIGQMLTVAVAAIAMQAVLPAIWSGFQFVGGSGADASILSETGAKNAVILGILLLVVTTLVNILGIRQMAATTSIGVAVEIVGVIVLVVVLFALSERGPAVVLHHTGWTGSGNYFFAWLASALMAAYVMVGFDSAGELAEETHSPRKTTPKTIIRALTTSGLGGGLLILGALMAAPSLTDGNLSTLGLSWVITERLGDVLGRLLLCCVAVAVFACTLACQTSGARMMYSMSREGAFPFHKALGKVSARTGTPILTSIVVGAGAALALAVNINSTTIFTALSSICIAMLYIAYLGVTLPLLVVRLRHRNTDRFPAGHDEDGKPLFTTGRFGLAINVVAVVYQAIMIVNLMWPRPEIYDLSTNGNWALQYSALLLVGAALLSGAGYFGYRRLHAHIDLVHIPHTHVAVEGAEA